MASSAQLSITVFFALVLILITISELAAGSTTAVKKSGGGVMAACSEKDVYVEQRQESRGRRPRWRLVVKSRCTACEASIVELNCPGWVEPKAIEGYMYPVELVGPDLCMVGAPVTPRHPFSYVYRQPTAHSPAVNLSVASVRFTCGGSRHRRHPSAAPLPT